MAGWKLRIAIFSAIARASKVEVVGFHILGEGDDTLGMNKKAIFVEAKEPPSGVGLAGREHVHDLSVGVVSVDDEDRPILWAGEREPVRTTEDSLRG